jgi:hypothetical protein
MRWCVMEDVGRWVVCKTSSFVVGLTRNRPQDVVMRTVPVDGFMGYYVVTPWL